MHSSFTVVADFIRRWVYRAGLAAGPVVLFLLYCVDAAGQPAQSKEPQAAVTAPSATRAYPTIACGALRDGIQNVTIPGRCLAAALARGTSLEIVSCRVVGDVNLRGAKRAGVLFAQETDFDAIDLTNATMQGLSIQSGRIERLAARGATIGNMHFSGVTFGEASFEEANLRSSYFSS
jgi:uncharacterized protein YjbI with pentapeptide repeats